MCFKVPNSTGALERAQERGSWLSGPVPMAGDKCQSQRTAIFSPHLTVLVCSSCHNQVPQPEQLAQQNFISLLSWRLEVQGQVSAGLVLSQPQSCWMKAYLNDFILTECLLYSASKYRHVLRFEGRSSTYEFWGRHNSAPPYWKVYHSLFRKAVVLGALSLILEGKLYPICILIKCYRVSLPLFALGILHFSPLGWKKTIQKFRSILQYYLVVFLLLLLAIL